MNIKNSGSTLVAVLIVTSIVTAGVGVAFLLTSQTARIADRSQDFAVVQAAAEGSIEYAFGVWKRRVAQKNGALTTQEVAIDTTALPEFPGATLVSLTLEAADEYGAPMSATTVPPTPAFVSVPNHTGWKGRKYNYVATATYAAAASLGGAGNVKYGVKRVFNYTEVPLFQSMFFYEHDFEMYGLAKTNVAGLVHTNGSAFVSNDLNNPVTFFNNVSYVGDWTTGSLPSATHPGFSADDLVTPYKIKTWGGFAEGRNNPVTFANSQSSQLAHVASLNPLGTDPKTLLDAPPTTVATMNAPSGQTLLPDGDSDGNPNNDSMHELVEPPVSGYDDPPEIARRRLYNKAGIVVEVNGSGVTVTAQNGTALTGSQIASIKAAVSTSSIFDKRQSSQVRVSSLDIGAVRPTLDALAGFNGVLYIHDTTAAKISTTSTVVTGNVTTAVITETPIPSAIRLVNGGVLPASGLTVASQNGIYIQGDYNTGATSSADALISVPSNSISNTSNDQRPTAGEYTRKPAAVIADAVMILSNSWSDANSSASVGTRIAGNTTVNTAIIAGLMPSGYRPASGDQYGYSGGAGNYPRFLETWSGRTFTYFGSMVELFASKSFAGKWALDDIYRPPVRCFNYDTKFDKVSPPGSVDAVAFNRGSWTRF